jgi:predicted nucleotide-binding protein
MARSRQPAAPAPPLGPPALTRPRAEVAAHLQERIDKGKELQARPIQSQADIERYKNDAQKWRDYNSDLLVWLFTDDSLKKEYLRSAMPSRMAGDEMEVFTIHQETVRSQISKLESIVERLRLYVEAVPAVTGSGEAARSEDRSKVFVVHGHDEGALQAVGRFLETIGLQAIILREQPDQGLTIIEKFEACASEVGFAVALLTPDDLGGAVAAPEQAARARQNVIFELGYFVGSLGRGRACLLRKGRVEIPSDLVGVIYTDMDHPAEGWKVRLARELRAAGFEVDANRVLA